LKRGIKNASSTKAGVFLWSYIIVLWGPRPALLAAAMLRGSQVCSALQPPLAALVWPSATPPQRWAAHRGGFVWAFCFGGLAFPVKRYSSLRSSFANMSPPTHPSAGFPKESLGEAGKS